MTPHTDDRYRRAAAAGGVGIWDWNLATGEIYIDPVLKELLGYQDHEIGTALDLWGQLMHPDDKDAVSAWAQAHASGNSPHYELEHRMRHRDGSVRWFLARASVTRDAAGAVARVAGTDTDITVRKRGEEALRQAEEINRRIVQSTGDCVKILDLSGRIIYINPEGLRQLELEDDSALLNQPLSGHMEGAIRLAANESVELARRGGTGRFQARILTGSGRVKWFDIVVTPITDANGTVVQLLAISRDITERRREETFRTTQNKVLGMIATGSKLADVLECLVHLIEEQADHVRCSVLLLDDGIRVRHGAAPSLPEGFVRAIDGLPIGPRSGSCGTAMFLGARVIVTDILADPLWEEYRDLAREYGLRACWSAPIFSPQRQVLGSFAMYYDEPRAPTDDELRLIESAADIARIAIEQERAQQALRHSEARNRAILRAIPDWMFLTTVGGVFLDYHARDPSTLHAPPAAFLGRMVTDVLPPHDRRDARAGVRTRRGIGRTRDGRVHAGIRRQRALLRGVHRPLRRRQDPQHRQGHHRQQAGRARGRCAAVGARAPGPGLDARRADGYARARVEPAADGCSEQRAGRATRAGSRTGKPSRAARHPRRHHHEQPAGRQGHRAVARAAPQGGRRAPAGEPQRCGSRRPRSGRTARWCRAASR